jgi:hypothetical protein
MNRPTSEQIASHYKAALDSVNLINSAKPEYYSDSDRAEIVARNKEHLKVVLAKDFWTTEDLTPLRNAAK